MNETYSSLEEFIKQFYHDMGIYTPPELSIISIAAETGMVVNYYDGSSMYAFNQFFFESKFIV